MEGFRKLPKMQCFKEGGSVKSQIAAFERKEEKTESKKDMAQDKAMVKKGVRQHESALHKGEPKTELKLKTGGRVKKAAGTVKKFDKASGEYGAKKTAQDKKNIQQAKLFKKEGGSACAPSAAKKAKNTPAKMCGGKSVKKMADGGQPGATEEQQKYYNKNRAEGAKKAAKADYEAFGSRGDAARKGMEEGRMDAMGNAYKKGGKAKVKKYAEGGAVLSDEEKAWLGGADATDPFILARMREALGPKKAAPVATAPAPAAPNPAMIEDESGRGNVTAAQQAFNKTIPGSGVNTPPAAAPSAPVAPARRPLVAGPSADQRLRAKYGRPQIDDESQWGNVTLAEEAFNKGIPGAGTVPDPTGNRSFNRSAQQRQNIGRRIGDWLGLNKKPGV